MKMSKDSWNVDKEYLNPLKGVANSESSGKLSYWHRLGKQIPKLARFAGGV